MAKKLVAPAHGILPRQGIVFIILVLAVQVNGNLYFKVFAKGKVCVFYKFSTMRVITGRCTTSTSLLTETVKAKSIFHFNGAHFIVSCL